MYIAILNLILHKYWGFSIPRSKDKAVMTARDVFCYIAIRVLLHSGTNVGNVLNIHRSAVSHAVPRGEGISEKSNDLVDKILK
jgi:putative transposase